MKKNIQINLFGTLYNIDDDAYQLLERYLDSMKDYFMRQDGGEEIADDIEHRVAELLWQRKQTGMEAVNIETIKEIISQIGDPQQIDAESDGDNTDGYTTAEEVNSSNDYAESRSASNTTSTNTRRLYRDPNDKMVGGVCSGLAAYVGVGDVTLWRLAFVVLPFLFTSMSKLIHLSVGGFWLLPMAYVLLWFIIPEARTAEDRLRMKGCEVTPESINEQIISDSDTATNTSEHSAPRSNNGGCLKLLLFFFIFLCCLPAIIAIIAILIVILFTICAAAGLNGIHIPFSGAFGIGDTFLADHNWIMMTGSIAGLFVIIIPLYLIIKKMMGSSFSRHTVPVLMIIWLLMTAWSMFSLIACASSFPKYMDPSKWNWNRQIKIVTNSNSNSQTDSILSMEELVDSNAIDLWSEE